jgi:SPP1 gp7 family putative phage head morphogenesis protein
MAKKIDPEKFAAIVEEQLIRGAMLGAADSMVERESEEPDPMPTLASWRAGQRILQKVDVDTKLTGMPFESAIKLFEERRILPKANFDQLTAAAKRKAFTVAGLANEELLSAAHGELARQIRDSREKTYYDEATEKWVYKGPNLREFDKFAKERLESAGWTPASPSHAETIFRTNVMGAYGSGRIVETTQPTVLALRPYWEILGVNDSRQRPAHRKAQGTVLAADNPFWRRAYPPFGYFCRCRVVTRSQRWVDAHGGPTRVPDGLPDPGFESGIDASLVPNPMAPHEGTRVPEPGKAAHPIERPHKPSPIVEPMKSAPLPVSELPPEPYKAPAAPEAPQEDSLGPQLGVHVGNLSIEEGLTNTQINRVLSAYNRDELGWLRTNPLRQLSIRRNLDVYGIPAVGSYSFGPSADEISIVASRASASYGRKLMPGSRTFSSTRATAEAAVRATARHELGHRLLIRCDNHIKLEAMESFSRATPITQRAGSNVDEWFAESYAMYREIPDVLELHDPEAFRIVRKVLDHWGIPHGTP